MPSRLENSWFEDVIFTGLELKYEHPRVWQTDIAQTDCTGVIRRDRPHQRIFFL